MTTGVNDFNHDEIYHLSRDLARSNIPHRFVEFEGGHEWLPPTPAAESFAFFLAPCPHKPRSPR